ncbi:MAG: GAF domain-containing protein, partial [Bacteroidota bacterium]
MNMDTQTETAKAQEIPSYIKNLPVRPANDYERIQALIEYCILDTDPEKEYDDITLIASEICQTPISSIGFIDENRQVLKSNRGLSDISPRDMTFCNHTINTPDEILVIPDSRIDPRFTDHPAVINLPHVIFYAGIPLVTADGYALGTLCVVDNKPRELSQQQLDLLKALANQVMKLLDLRKNNIQLATISKQLHERALELQDANQELESFSYTVSHDLQSPLRSISGFSTLLLKLYSHQLDEDGKEFLNTIHGSVARMGSLIQDLLKLSRLGKTPLTKAETDMGKLAGEMINEVRLDKTYEKTEIHLYTLEPSTCDPGLMKQVWANLIGNAVKYSGKKEKPVVEIGMQQIEGE